SGDGKYLFFVSNRDFSPTYSSTEWNHVYRDMARIYLVTLGKDTPSPFRHRSDAEEEAKPPKAKPGEGKGPGAKGKEVALEVDREGIEERGLRLPVAAANYRNLQSVGSSVYYLRQGSKDAKPAFAVYDLEARKETALGSVSGFDVAAGQKKMIVSQDGKY